jgi:ribulose-phosphate 3-epimerase
MKISASVYSNKSKSLEQTVRDADLLQIDYLHIDCNDDPSVFDDIAFIRRISKTPIDLHLITSAPDKYFELVEKNGVEWLTLQHELLSHDLEFPAQLRSRRGISFTSQTPVSAFERYKDKCTFILFMTTTPGQSGGKFDQETFQRIREFRRMYPGKRIHVDGGVNADVAFALKTLGVSCAVSGSFLVCASDMAQAVLGLQGRSDHHSMTVRDFMRSLHETPSILSDDLSLEGILQAIDRSKMGFVTVISASGELQGVVTDGDIRRAILGSIGNLQDLPQRDLVNRNPLTVEATATVGEMLHRVRENSRPILFLPVIDSAGKLVGSLSFNDIVKGEL